MEDYSHRPGPQKQTTAGIITTWFVRLLIFAFVIYQVYLAISG